MDHIKYVDAHVHLNFTHFDHDQDKVIAEMKKKGIGAVNIGIDEQTSQKSVGLAEEYDHLWASVGCHPTEAASEFAAGSYRNLARQSDRVVAIGECGLDYSRSQYRSDKQKSIQEDVFTEQIKLAAEMSLPLILHIRPQEGSMDAYEDGLDILRHFQNKTDTDLTGTAHFFVGSKDIAREFLDLGFYVSFTGPITYDERLQRVAAEIPQNRLLAETDSPFAAPEPHRGKRNSPLYVPKIVDQLARAKEVRPSDMRTRLLTNTDDLFGLFNSTAKLQR